MVAPTNFHLQYNPAPFGDDEFNVAVMALVIQYIPDPMQAMSEITRVVQQRGTVAAYVWPAPDEGHPMQPLQDAVKSIGVSPVRRPGKQIRTIEGLTDLFDASGFQEIDSRSIENQFIFKDFDDILSEPGGPIYCEFTLQGSRNDFRGVAKLWPGPTAPNSSDITAIAAE